jgi:hypothetical protein
MLRAEHLFVDRQRALQERPRFCKIALVPKQVVQILTYFV